MDDSPSTSVERGWEQGFAVGLDYKPRDVMTNPVVVKALADRDTRLAQQDQELRTLRGAQVHGIYMSCISGKHPKEFGWKGQPCRVCAIEELKALLQQVHQLPLQPGVTDPDLAYFEQGNEEWFEERARLLSPEVQDGK